MQRKRSHSSSSSVNLLELEQKLPGLPPWYVRVTIYGIVILCFVMVFFLGPDPVGRMSEMSLLSSEEKTDAPYPPKVINWENVDGDAGQTLSCFDTTTAPSFRMCARDVDYEIKRQTWADESEYGKKLKNAMEMFPKAGFVDVGANVGFFTLFVAKMGKTVLTVEPFADNMAVLLETAKMNGLDGKITLIQNAITDKYEKVPFSNPIEKSDNNDHSNQQTIYAESVTMNDLAAYAQFKEAILRIDVGGQECWIFEKSNLFFKKLNVHQIFMEWETINGKDEKCVEDMIKILKTETYNPFLLSGVRMQEAEWKNWKDDIIIWKREN